MIIKYLDKNISNMLNEIELLTNKDSFWSNHKYSLSHTLLAYCSNKNFKDGYDGLFWGNEGYNWKYNKNEKVVKLIDDLFIYIRENYYSNMAHISYSNYMEIDNYYKTRYNYVCEKTI